MSTLKSLIDKRVFLYQQEYDKLVINLHNIENNLKKLKFEKKDVSNKISILNGALQAFSESKNLLPDDESKTEDKVEGK